MASIAVYFQQERGQLGGYGSMAHVVSANAFFFLMLGYYVRDKWTGAGVVTGQPLSGHPSDDLP